MVAHKWIKLLLCFIFFNDVAPIPNINLTLNENKFTVLTSILTRLHNCNKKIKKTLINCDADENLIKSFSNLKSVSVNLHCNSSNINPNRLRSQSGSLVAVDDSVDKMEQILNTFKKSPWWNIQSHFFLLSGSKNGCNDAEQVLKTAWKMNILKCYFACFDSDQKPFIYTFNPYSKYAPAEWNIVQEIEGESHYMAIYNRAYNEDNICKNFNFGRLKYLDKAVLNLALCIPPSQVDSLPKLTEENHHLIYSHFEEDMFQLFKVGFKIRLKYDYDLEPFYDPSEPQGVYKRLLNKTSDVTMCLSPQQFIFDFYPSHQILYSGFSIFSRNRGFRTPLEKMYNFYGPVMSIATIMISAITYVVIWYVNKLRGHWFAIFEIIRLWTSTSVYTKLDSLALRIFFGVIFIYFLILQATFSGHLSKFLTNPELRHNAETLEDLQNSRYETIYVTPSSKYFIADDEILRPKSHSTTVFEGIDAVLEKESNALISIYMGLLIVFKRMNMSKHDLQKYYLSKNFIRDNYFIYAIRHDWPLKNMFNGFLILLEDTGNLLKLNKDFTANLEALLVHDELNPEFKPIDIESLLFIFYFWGIGLFAATIFFILERWRATKV